MIFDIINPSDAYTLESDDFEIACMAALYLGAGQYGLRQVDGDLVMPIFAIGGKDYLDKWWQDTFHHPFESKDSQREPVAKVLDSVVIGSPTDRGLYLLALRSIDSAEAREHFRAEWYDKKQSSLNDIGKAARDYAAQLRQKRAEERTG